MVRARTSASIRRRVSTIVLVAVVGGALHALAITGAVRWAEWDANRITAECKATDCQPQYYLGTALGFYGFVLPGAYSLGWIAIMVAARASVGRTGSTTVVWRLANAAVVTTVGLIGYSVWLASLPEGHRWDRWIGGLSYVPIIMSLLVAAATTPGSRAPTAPEGPPLSPA